MVIGAVISWRGEIYVAPRIPTFNTVRIKVEFPDGAPPPRLARIALLDNRVHRVVNPRRQHVATFHDLPAGVTHATITVAGQSVGRQRVVIPEKGEVEVTLRARGGADDDGFAYHGGFRVLDEHSGEPLRGRKYRITSASGINVTGETDENGDTRRIGTHEVEELHLELIDDDDDGLNLLHPDDEDDDDDDDDDDDTEVDDDFGPDADEREED